MKICLIGAGAVATHLGTAFYKAGLQITQVFSHQLENASILAEKLKASPYNDIQDTNDEATIYIIAVKDDVLQHLILKLPPLKGLVVHTAGSLKIDVFASKFEHYGIFYPLQTFSKQKEVNFEKVPICLEANSKENLDLLKTLAEKISHQVFELTEIQRQKLHVSAVFACNFVNLMYHQAALILEQENLTFDLLKPLIVETAEKVMHHQAKDVQTGPAMRKDINIIEKHKQLLTKEPELLKIYDILSQQIINLHK